MPGGSICFRSGRNDEAAIYSTEEVDRGSQGTQELEKGRR
jgi:hypothetical protein